MQYLISDYIKPMLISMGGFLSMTLDNFIHMTEVQSFITWFLGVLLVLGMLHKIRLDIKLRKQEVKAKEKK